MLDVGLSYNEIGRYINCTAMMVMRVCVLCGQKKLEEHEEDQLVNRGVPQNVKIGAIFTAA